MSTDHIFFNPFEQYERDFDVLGNYVQTTSAFLAAYFKTTKEEAEKKLLKRMKKDFAPVSPTMGVLRREPMGDRAKAKIDFLSYLKWVSDNQHILAPNMICYANPETLRSELSSYVLQNIIERSLYKKKAKASEMKKDAKAATKYNLLQSNKKFFNNSVSGATSSPHNPFYYVSEHTTLTSTCRSCTSYANGINERLLASNRHYHSPDVTLENIFYITENADLDLIGKTMERHGLMAPTPEFVFEQVVASTRLYWQCAASEEIIRVALADLTPLELSAVAFVGDLYAMGQVNSEWLRDFYTELMYEPGPIDNPDDYISKADDDIISLVSIMSKDYMQGVSLSDLKEKDYETYKKYGARLKYVIEVFEDKRDFIQAFLITPIMPGDMYMIPSTRRKAVLGSDTDSSLYSTQNFVKWYTDEIKFNLTSYRVAAITAFFSSKCVAHAMLKLSTQIGVEEKEKFRIAMKPEYMFDVFIVTQRTKHYLAVISAKEGNVYDKPKLEIKGVNLKSSKLPKKIRALGEEWYKQLMLSLRDNVLLTPKEVMSVPAYIEHVIKEEISAGNTEYLINERIKPKDQYSRPMSSNYLYYELWEDVFAPDYINIPELPATGVKINVDLPNKASLDTWAENLGEVKGRKLKQFVERVGRKNFTSIVLPYYSLPGNKVPSEFISVLDWQKLIKGLVDHLYIVLECYGIFVNDKHGSTMCHEYMTKEEARKHIFFDYDL